MTIKDELVALQQEHEVLQAEMIVEWAKVHPTSKLHAALEWDDDVAAVEYRIWQARRLIAIHVVSATGVRQLVSLVIDRGAKGGGYRDLNAVMASKPLREMLLAEALADLERVRLKYEGLVELAAVWAATDQVRKRQSRPRLALPGGSKRRKRSAV